MSTNANSFGLREILLLSRDGNGMSALKYFGLSPEYGGLVRVGFTIDKNGNINENSPYFNGTWECPKIKKPVSPMLANKVINSVLAARKK